MNILEKKNEETWVQFGLSPRDKVATAGLHNGTWPSTDDATDTNLDTSKAPTYFR